MKAACGLLLAAFLAAGVIVGGAPHAYASTTSTTSTTVPTRIIALRWAEAQAGKPYTWGGTGPGGFDCSGLVVAAYEHAGIKLPRTTFDMLADIGLKLVRVAHPQRGDLAFYGSGHVELVTRRGTFGALKPGTVIGWHHPGGSWFPTMYFRVE